MTEFAIKVDGVSKSFRLPHEKYSGLKQTILNFRASKKFELQYVLKDISFEIKKGEFFGIAGRNGSGKSTLLKILAQIYIPNAGQVHINGSLTPFIELGVGFNPELTGRENVYLNGALLGFDRAQMAGMYNEIVEFAELRDFMDQKLKNYSSGMQVRLAFSIATRAQSDILLLDEVLAVGDAAFQQKCYDYFEDLKQQKKTVVFVSHDMGAMKRFCNRAVYIQEGKLIKEGSPAEIADLYAEENIRREKAVQEAELNLSPKHSIKADLSANLREQHLEISFHSHDKDDMYIGISITRDGVSVAEIASDYQRPLNGSGKVSYNLDTSLLNPGVYQIAGISLFRLQNRELLAINKNKLEFAIGGDDRRRGGALKLPDKWTYEKN